MNGILDRLRSRSGTKRIRAEPGPNNRVHEEVEATETSSNGFFLTFPKNDTPKEVAMERVKEMFKDNLKGALICQEKHQGESQSSLVIDKHLNFKCTCFQCETDPSNYRSDEPSAPIPSG